MPKDSWSFRWIVCLIEKERIYFGGHRKQLQTVTHSVSTFIPHYGNMSPIWVQQWNNLISIVVIIIIQKWLIEEVKEVKYNSADKVTSEYV